MTGKPRFATFSGEDIAAFAPNVKIGMPATANDRGIPHLGPVAPRRAPTAAWTFRPVVRYFFSMPCGFITAIPIAFLLLATRPIWTQAMGVFPAPRETSTGEHELEALARAYPDRISEAAFHDGDWAVRMDGQWYFWAHGRILSLEERSRWEQYASFRFYRYPLGGLPPLPQLDPQSAARLQQMVRETSIHPPQRWEGFIEKLFHAESRQEIVDRMVAVNFLGFSVEVHEGIASALESVARECEALRAHDPKVSTFFAGLKEIDGFNDRDVAGTKTRSYHGYGLAADLIPKSYGAKQPYWRWTLGKVAQWWAIPYNERWTVPDAVVAAFEQSGFVWGGKWLFFDTMHFEYRPEIFILSREQNIP